METETFEDILAKKGFELAYALFRLADYLSEEALMRSLKNSSIELLIATGGADAVRTKSVLRQVSGLVRFGSGVGLVSPVNLQILNIELKTLGDLLKSQPAGSSLAQQADVSMFLSRPKDRSNVDIRTESKKEVRLPVATESKSESQVAAASVSEKQAIVAEDKKDGNIEERQTAILQIIRQKANCHLKDIQEELPNFSERTIRYDLQRLIEKGLVTRIGGGGPFSYYQLNQAANGNGGRDPLVPMEA